MGTLYLLLSAFSVLAVAIGIFLYSYYADREKTTEYDNCELNPKNKERACCKKNKEISIQSGMK